MSDKNEILNYVESPKLLLKLCREVIDELYVHKENSEIKEMETQLKEISKTIDKLEEAQVQIPEDLRRLKVDLISQLSVQDEIDSSLKELATGLEEITYYLKKRIGKDIDKFSSKIASSCQPVRLRTDRKTLRAEIIDILKANGGSGRINEIRIELEEKLKNRLLPGDLERRKSGELVWWNNVCWERYKMTQDGTLKKNSERGIWELEE